MTDRSTKIDALLASPSSETGSQLVAWADSARERIVGGELMIGLLPLDDVPKIPLAYQAAAEHGLPSAWITLSQWFCKPEHGEPDLYAAESAIKRAIDESVEGAALELVKLRWFYQREMATVAEQAEAFGIAEAIVASEPKNSEAIYILALLQSQGFGTDESPEEAVKLLKEAAKLENNDAVFELFLYHYMGLGVAKDERKAMTFLRKAADAEHARAMYNMGAFHATGTGEEKDMAKAIGWYERASAAGSVHALLGLATIYGTGDGVEVNMEYAEDCLNEAEYCGAYVDDVRERIGLPVESDESD